MIDSLFQKNVKRFDKKVKRSFFPESFLNEIYYSTVAYESNESISYTSNFSIKYVLDGKELYFLDGKRYAPKAGQYLIINDGRKIETKPIKGSEGISIFLEKKLITEVYQTLNSGAEELLDKGLVVNSMACPEFFENNFYHRDTLGLLLQKLSGTIKTSVQEAQPLRKEVYYLIAEKLIQSQKNIDTDINQIMRVKRSTREELYKKALLAKEYIHSNLRSDFNLDLLSNNVGLSKYHLIRIFKSTFFQSPYQYYLICKVNLVKHYIEKKQHSLVEIADLCGFNDVFVLSKTFKKIEGITPSTFRHHTK